MVPKSISSPVTLLHVLCVFQIWMWRCRFLTATEQENNQQSIFIRVCFNENRLPLKIHWTIIIYKLHRIAACFKNPGYVVVVIVFFAFFLSHCMWCQAVCNLVGNPRKLVMSLKKNGSKGAFVKWQEFLQHLKWWIGRNWSVFSSPEEAVDCSKKGDLDRGRIQRNSVSSQGDGFAYPEPSKMRIEVSKMGMGM